MLITGYGLWKNTLLVTIDIYWSPDELDFMIAHKTKLIFYLYGTVERINVRGDIPCNQVMQIN